VLLSRRFHELVEQSQIAHGRKQAAKRRPYVGREQSLAICGSEPDRRDLTVGHGDTPFLPEQVKGPLDSDRGLVVGACRLFTPLERHGRIGTK
jgi:hypothetical protein